MQLLEVVDSRWAVFRDIAPGFGGERINTGKLITGNQRQRAIIYVPFDHLSKQRQMKGSVSRDQDQVVRCRAAAFNS